MNTNILVTSYATQESPSQGWGGDPTSLDLASYEKILKMLTSSGEKHFNLIGGEPTAHPNLKPILEKTNEWCKNNAMTATLVTNGTYLESFIPSIGAYIDLVIQCAALKDFAKVEQYTEIYATLQHIDNLGWFESGKAICQFEIQSNNISYEYVENLFSSLGLKKVRINFSPSPLGGSPEEYYDSLKVEFLAFCQLAYKYHIAVEVNNYNAIPFCYYNAEEKALIKLVCEDYPKYSEAFRLVVLPNLDCIYDRYNNMHQVVKAHLTEFDSMKDLNKYLLLAIYYPLTTQKCEGRCATCPQADLFKCDGRYLFKPDAKIKEDNIDE